MTNVGLVPLGDVLTDQREEVVLQPGETYRTAGIYSFGRGIFERTRILGADTSYQSLFRLRENQFVLSRLNGWEGAVDVVASDVDGCLVSNEFPSFAIDSDRADPGYLRWIARWPRFWEQLIPRGSMVRRKRVQTAQLFEVRIPLPPIDEQRRVASRLDRVAKAVERIGILESQADALAAAARVSLTSPSTVMVGWHSVTLGDVVELHCDQVDVEADRMYPAAGVYSFGQGLFSRADLEGSKTSYSRLHQIRTGQLVMSRLKAWEGALAIVPREFDGYFLSPEFPTFTIDTDRLEPGFLDAFIGSSRFWARLKGASKGIGARKERVHAQRLLEQTIEIPPLETQRRIARSLNQLGLAGRMRTVSRRQIASLVPSALNATFGDLP